MVLNTTHDVNHLKSVLIQGCVQYRNSLQTFRNSRVLEIGNFAKRFVTADIIAHQVLLNRVPEQATEDNVKYQIYY